MFNNKRAANLLMKRVVLSSSNSKICGKSSAWLGSGLRVVKGKSIPMMMVQVLNNSLQVQQQGYHYSCTKYSDQKQSQNYTSMLLSKLYQVSSEEDRHKTIEHIRKDLFSKELDNISTHNIMKQLDCLEKEDFTIILNEFIEKDKLVSSMKHGSGYKILIRLYDGLDNMGKETLLNHCIFNQDLFDICTGNFSSITVKELITRMNESELDKFIKLFNSNLIQELSKNSTGAFLISKLIQIETNKDIIRMVETHLGELIVHPIGNYVVQEIIKKMDDRDHFYLMHKFKEDFKHIASSQQGSIVIKQFMTSASDRVLEAFFTQVVLPDFKAFVTSKATPALDIIFARIGPEKQCQFVEKLSLNIMDVIGATAGSIFTQKLVKQFTEPQSEIFLQNIKPKIKPIMEGTASSFVVPTLFDHCNKQGKKEILISLKPHFLEMAYNRNSSRVLQHILGNCDRSELDAFVLLFLANFDNAISHESSAPIFRMIVERGFGESVFLRMKGNLEKYAFHPLGSFVVSQCLKNTKKSVTDQMLMELLVDGTSQNEISTQKVLKLIKSKSGSFVVLDCLQLAHEKYANQTIYRSLLETLDKNIHVIRHNSLKQKVADLSTSTQ